MARPGAVTVRTTVSRHHPEMPRLAVVPAAAVAPWRLAGTTTVDAEINGEPVGRRNIKRWDDARWWIDLPAPLCSRLGIDVGSPVTLTLEFASTALPAELEILLKRAAAARRAWAGLTAAQQRMVREDVAAAKRPETRRRRARARLGLGPK